MIEIKRLSECSLTEVLEAWNNGFKGYFTEMTMNVDQFLKRMVQEGLSAHDSIIAYVDGVPAGIILNGFRTLDGEVVSYNGGTGVAPQFRRTGIGRKMMEHTLEIYREKGVKVATLEAIVENDQAIHLYESLGFVTNEHVAYLQQEGTLSHAKYLDINDYVLEQTLPEMVSHLPFYSIDRPWQTQWQSSMNGNAIIVHIEGHPIGYAIYRKAYHPDGKLATIVLHQVGTDPGYSDHVDLIRFILSFVLEPDVHCKRLVVNCLKNDQPIMDLLTGAGFTTMVEQVWMKKGMKEPSKTNAKSIEKI